MILVARAKTELGVATLATDKHELRLPNLGSEEDKHSALRDMNALISDFDQSIPLLLLAFPTLFLCCSLEVSPSHGHIHPVD